MRVQTIPAVVVFVGVFTVLGGLVSAHHSFAGYDRKTTLRLKGTVIEFRWRNPHVILIWDVKDESGQVARWTGEMLSPITNIGLGLTRNSLKAGDEVTVIINPGPNNQAVVISIVDAQGKVLLQPQNPINPREASNNQQ